MEDIDFDPLTQEKAQDLDDQIDDEYTTLIPNEDESEHSWYSRMRQKFGDNWKYATDHINDLFKSKNKGDNLPVYMELQNLDEKPGIEKILEKYPDWNPLSNII